nr:hypothetical protein HAGR004_15170 [Bdellovibrio sp. HAGR004]
MIDFPSINRSVLIINLKQPYIEWTKTLPDRTDMEKESPPTVEELNADATSYLIPEMLDDADFETYIEHSWELLFELQLSGWIMDEKLWPKKRTLKMFNEWFDLKCSSLVVDLWGKDPLEYAD